jgi:endo-1,4-beta-xylanase
MPRTAFLALICLPWTLHATLPKGQDLLSPPSVSAFSVPGDNQRGRSTLVQEQGTQLLLLETSAEDNANPWDVQASAPCALDVTAGDRILASFWIRSLKSRAESGESKTEFVFERSAEPWTKSVSFPLGAGQAWRQIQIPFEAAESEAKGLAHMVFRMGYAPEAFEIRDLSVVDFGKSVPLSELPRTKLSYPGRDSRAPWRALAQERIRRYRTAALRVRVVDTSGKPVSGARIGVLQTRSAFHFGTAVSGHYVFKDSDPAGRAKYEETLKRYFNMATEENALKWAAADGSWGKDWGMDLALKSADWVRSLGLEFRAHNLIWPSWRNMPKSAEALKSDPKALRRAVFDHIRSMAKAMAGRADQWDVMNEPFDNHDLMDIFGDRVMVDFYNAAREADPKAELFINDYAILSGGGGDSPHRRHYEKTIQYLLEQGAPLDGIGMQGHFGNDLTGPDDLLKLLDRYAHYGKKIMVTEFDIDVDDGVLAADYLRDLLTVLYSHPDVEGFVMWGFWDGAHWHHKAPLFNQDWSPKPSAKVWEDLVLHAWRSDLQGLSDAKGSASFTGYLGDYDIRASKDGKSGTARAALGPGGLDLQLTLE